MPPKKKASPPTQAQAQAQQVIINIAEEKRKKRAKRRKPKRAPEPSGYDILRRTVAYQAPMPPEYQRESMGKTYRDLLTTMMAITTERNAKTADQIQLQLPVAQPTRLEQIQQTAETIGAVAGTVGDVGEAVGKVAEGVGKVAEGVGATRDVLADTPFEGQPMPTLPDIPVPSRAPLPTTPSAEPRATTPSRAPRAPRPRGGIPYSNKELEDIVKANVPRRQQTSILRMRKADKYEYLVTLGYID